VPVVIHALMQNADDIDAIRDEPVKQDVRTGSILVIARPQFRAFPAHGRAIGYLLDVIPKLAGIYLRLVGAPAPHRVVSNFVKVGLSAWC
jgi:hypothetical protein